MVKAKKIEKNCCSVEAAFTTDVESKICFSFAKKRRSLHTKRGSEADIVARFFRDLEALLIGAPWRPFTKGLRRRTNGSVF